MTGVYVSGHVASWSTKYLDDGLTKTGLRAALRDHAEVVEFYIHPTVVSRGGYATLREMTGLTEVKVTTQDGMRIIGVIVPKVVDGAVVDAVVK